MSNRIEWLASIPPTDGAMKAHGDGGFRITFDMPDSEAPAYVRMLLARGHVLKMITEWDEAGQPTKRQKKARPRASEWGDDDDDTG